MNRTALVADRRYLDHYAGRVHPERPERVAVMIEMAGVMVALNLTRARQSREAVRISLAMKPLMA